MLKNLGQIANIGGVHPFRGSIENTPAGDGHVVQVRDMNNDGLIAWEDLTCTHFKGRKEPAWLIPGDIIFSARGTRNIACLVPTLSNRLSKPAVCGPHFFHIKVANPDKVLPSFLSWQLNQKASQRYFRIAAQGSAQVSISRTHLEAIPVFIPPLKKQQAIVELSNLATKEKQLMEKLIDNRRREIHALAQEVLK